MFFKFIYKSFTIRIRADQLQFLWNYQFQNIIEAYKR